MRQIIFISVGFSIILSAFGCNSKQEPKVAETVLAEKVKPKVEKAPEMGTFNGDTINLSGSFVVFFGPPKNADATPVEIKEFHDISEILVDSLQKNSSIFSTFTSVNNLRVYDKSTGIPMVIMRNTFTEPVGVIISDGNQSPIIKKGFGTLDEFRKIIDSRFIKPS